MGTDVAVGSQYGRSKVGFPIRKSSDQSLFAAPRSLSQRTTSFIASQRQGIHRMPLRHLITLMIDARHPARRQMQTTLNQKDHCGRPSRVDLLPNMPHVTRHSRADPTSRGDRKRRTCSLFTMSQIASHPGNSHGQARTSYPGHSTDTEPSPPEDGDGGARRDRTDDLMLAKHALSQLSYGPTEP